MQGGFYFKALINALFHNNNISSPGKRKWQRMYGKQRIFRATGFVAFHKFVADKFLKNRVWAFETPNISTKIYGEPV
jgi:hypothetical protein